MTDPYPEALRGDILIVDDIPENLRILFTILSEQKYDVRRVINGKQALIAAQSDPPDLILLDIKMPDMDGYEVCQQLKASERTAHIPVIFLSALDEPLDKVKAFAVGGVDYITKPFNLEEVLARVKTQIGLQQIQQQLRAKNQDLETAKGEADAANSAKSNFLAVMSHEIRNPLNAVIGMAGLLNETQLDPQQQDYVETIRHSGELLLSIVNDILDFSKIESGKLELEAQPFDLRKCLEESLDLLAPKAAQKNLGLAYFIDPKTPFSVVGDVTRLRQILVNLLSNAVKFTKVGEVAVSVTSRAIFEEIEFTLAPRYEIQFAVQDTGIGIPPERFDRLFQRFSQVDSSTSRQYGGTGLGLVICRQLSEMMGGKIWLESQVGEGTIFYFTVIMAATEDRKIDRFPIPPQLANKRVLIVDDSKTNCRFLSQQVKAWGMLPTLACSGKEALATIDRGERFDVAILDGKMSDMDGLVLADQIRQRLGDRNFPLVMQIAMDSPATTGKRLEAYVTACLTQPIKQSQLCQVLSSLMPQTPELSLREPPLSIPSSSVPSSIPVPNGSAPLRILLAEDNRVNQKVGLHLLKKMGYEAELANNGLEVLDALRRQTYDVVFMDIQMPEMDGLAATQYIKTKSSEFKQQNPHFEMPRIIAMTANALHGDREVCLEAGMDDYISKPIRMEDLQRALDMATGKL
ncbi:MAG: response regulator [Geitlerinemataceae cyanobacterium]